MSKNEETNGAKRASQKESNIRLLKDFATLNQEQMNVIGQIFNPLPEYGTNKPKPPPITRLETIIFGLGVDNENSKKVYGAEKDFNLDEYEKTKKYYKDADGKIHDYNNGKELKDNGEKIAALAVKLGQKYGANSYTYAFRQEIEKISFEINLIQSRSFGLISESLDKAKTALQNKINEEINAEFLSNIDKIKSNPIALSVINEILANEKFKKDGLDKLKDGSLEKQLEAIVSSKEALKEFIKTSENKGLLKRGNELYEPLNVVKYKAEQNTFPLLQEHMPTYQYSALLRNSEEILQKYQQIEKRLEKQQKQTIAYGEGITIESEKPTHAEFIKAVTKLILDQKQITGLDPNSPDFKDDLAKLSSKDIKERGKLEIAFEHGEDIVAYKINSKDFIKLIQRVDPELIKKMDPDNIRKNNPELVDKSTGIINERNLRSEVSKNIEKAGISEKSLADSFEKRNQKKIEKSVQKGKRESVIQELQTSSANNNELKGVNTKNIVFPADIRKSVEAESAKDIKRIKPDIKIAGARQRVKSSSEISSKTEKLPANVNKRSRPAPLTEAETKELQANVNKRPRPGPLTDAETKELQANINKRQRPGPLTDAETKKLQANVNKRQRPGPLTDAETKKLQANVNKRPRPAPLTDAETKELQANVNKRPRPGPLTDAENKELQANINKRQRPGPLTDAETKELQANVNKRQRPGPLTDAEIKEFKASVSKSSIEAKSNVEAYDQTKSSSNAAGYDVISTLKDKATIFLKKSGIAEKYDKVKEVAESFKDESKSAVKNVKNEVKEVVKTVKQEVKDSVKPNLTNQYKSLKDIKKNLQHTAHQIHDELKKFLPGKHSEKSPNPKPKKEDKSKGL